MRLRHFVAGETFAPVVVVALAAGEIELTLALVVDRAALLDEGRKPRIVRQRDRLAARLQAQIGGQRQHLLALERERRRVLMPLAAEVDALLQIDRLAELVVE